jgi:1-acyl-sn-glycerol-3-phosphate acyltransferase
MKKFYRGLIKLILKLTCKIEKFNFDRVPAEGGCILAANHLGRLDAVLVYALVSRKDILLTPAEKYSKIALFRWAAKSLNAIFLDRFKTDFKTIRAVLKRLKQGELMVVAPEGTRSKTETLNEGLPGAAYFAMKTDVPIFPVGITGTEDRLVVAGFRRFRRADVLVQMGEPFYLPPQEDQERDDYLKLATDEIMCQIAALLPQKYHGYYADHPRLAELLSTQGNITPTSPQ